MKICPFCKSENPFDAKLCQTCGRSLEEEPGKRADLRVTGAYLKPGDVLGNRYEVLELIGTGGMGIVYKARDRARKGELIAIKVLTQELANDERAVEDLINEANIAMRLSHHNIMRLHNFEDASGYKFLVMEYLEGPTLDKVLAKRKKLSEEETIFLAKQICDGLAYAHSQNVIHRDLKPSNLMLAKPLPDWQASLTSPDIRLKICDFGIARIAKDSHTRITGRMTSGTLIYMSPEHIRGKKIDTRSDIYSLGCVLYELLSGRPPFYTGDIYSQHLYEQPEPLKEVPPALNSTILKCLEKDPASRWQSANELKAALEGEVIAERAPESVAIAEVRPGRKLLRPIGFVLGLVAIVALGIVGYHISTTQKTKERAKYAPVVQPTATPVELAAPAPTPAPAPSKPPLPTPTPAHTPLPTATSVPTRTPLPTATAIQKEIPVVSWIEVPPKSLAWGAHRNIEIRYEGKHPAGGIDHYEYRLNEGEWKTTKLASITLQELTPGNNKIELVAVDPDRERSQPLIHEIKVVTKAPTIEWIKAPAQGTTVRMPPPFTLEVKAADEDGKITGYYFSLDTPRAPQKQPEPTLDLKDLAEGEHTIYAFAEDDAGARSEQISKRFKVERNLAPTLGIASIAKKINEGENLIARFQGKDPDGKITGYAYRLNTWSDWKQTSSSEITIAELVPGNYTLYAYAIDNDSCPSNEIETQFEVIQLLPSGFRAKPGTSPEPYTNTGWPKEIIHEKTGIELVFIPAGSFQMGSPSSELGRDNDERPLHTVRITKPFYLGKYEVTQGQWQAMMGSNPSNFRGSDQLPVENVSWNYCQVFLKRIGDGFSLPSEAEWEYACRAGTQTRYFFGDDESDLGNYAWYDANSGNKTHPLAQKKPNAWGLYDMHGNVREWCEDGYHDSYAGAPSVGRPWESPIKRYRWVRYSGYSKFEEEARSPRDQYGVVRGGSWSNRPSHCRSAHRGGGAAVNLRSYDVGFRLLWTQ